MAFTHLHVHTQYSLLDGYAVIEKVCARAKELGMDSLAITDHGVMYGAVDFYRECKNCGIKPVIGCEIYVAPGSMLSKDPEKDRRMYHLVLLSENNTGYKNLIKIVSESFTRGFYYKPRADKELLRKYSGGIICTSACLAGEVQQCLVNGDYEAAKQAALEYRDIFGEDNFFLEIQDQGIEEEHGIYDDILRLHRETGIPLVATNDVHYVDKSDAAAHDVLLCIQTGSTLDDPDRLKFSGDEFYLKSEREMRALFPELPDAVENTHKIAERCNVEFEFGHLHLPQFDPPDGKTPDGYLRELCNDGFEKRYPEGGKELRERLEYELSTIESMGYVEYFLIVWDFINYAKSQGIAVGPGRGSAAGSIVSYCLGITDVDPIKYGLIFERFLNPERVSMPDIDVDFCYERRHEVIEYVQRKYGADHVAQIVTFGTMKAKLAVRDVGRVLGASYAEADSIAKAIPNMLGITIDKALEMNPELKKKYETDELARRIIDVSRQIEGMPRHASTHAAGIVITKEPVEEYVPLTMTEKGPATQFTMVTIEELGLLKMDFLGLRNLTIIRDAQEMIRKNHGVDIDFENIEYDDPAVFRIISDGNTDGIFQLESGGMTSFMKELKPDCLEDIIAGIALYRPGPMASIPTYIDNKKNPDHIRYLDPSLEPILSVTYGCMVYQEQVMQIVRDLAGYSYGRSDIVRRAMSKKKKEVMLREREVFIYGQTDEDGNVTVPGAVRNGVPEDAAKQIYDQMVSFASYAFNKSHAAAYAVVGYETAYLKAHYPAEFMAALMSNFMGSSVTIAEYIRNCEQMGIKVLPPDITTCGRDFTVRDGDILFGLKAVKGVGDGVVDAIVEARKRNGVPKTIFDFIDGIDISKVNKGAVESLIRAGATSSLEGNTAQHLAVYGQLMEAAQNDARRNVAGQISLFDTGSPMVGDSGLSRKLPDIADFDRRTKAAMEKSMLGIYLTYHPLKEYEDVILKITNISSRDLKASQDPEDPAAPAVRDGQPVVCAGIVTNVRTIITKTNRMMASVGLEDLFGEMEIIVFPKTYEQYSALLRDDAVVAISGRVDYNDEDDSKIIASKISGLEEYQAAGGGPVKFRIPPGADAEGLFGELKNVILHNKGDRDVIIYMPEGKALRGSASMRVSGSEKMRREAEDLLGTENVKC
ncbi:MAG: DNA polymerase III subunit alpha [Anaerovoracaceae bacterium]|jgi:DNA polymerase-3 subunit alpha